jgi:polyisoprenoid-binding protein YceI
MAENAKTTWAVDPNHSQVQFKVKHLGIANVNGTFSVFKGTVQTESDDFNNAQISFEVDANSLTTKHDERDNQLKSPIFLDVEKFPKITFSGILKKSGDSYALNGDLTIHGTTRPVTLEVEFTGIGKGRFNDIRAGFEVSGKIIRKDFGLTFNLATEAGNLIVGEEVKLHFDIELIKQAN